MPMTGTSELSAELADAHDSAYYIATQEKLYFDQFCYTRDPAPAGQVGQVLKFPILEATQPNTTALDEYTDVSSQRMRANEVSVTLYEYGNAIDVTKFLVGTSYVDVLKQAGQANGYNLAESLDKIVRATAGQGSRIFRPVAGLARTTTNGLDTATHRLSATLMEQMAMYLRAMGMPLYDDGSVCTVIHPFPWHDLLQDDEIETMASRQHPEINFNGELAYWSGIRMIVASSAKAFWGAGQNRTSNAFASTLSTAAAVGDTNLKFASDDTDLAADEWVSIKDAEETGNTWSDTNELFRVTTVGTTGSAGTGIDGWVLDYGQGEEGGLRYAHASGTTIEDAASVYPLCFFGPQSITKIASDLTGDFGTTVVSGPFDKLGRFLTFGWYAILGYTRTRAQWMPRLEVGSSIS